MGCQICVGGLALVRLGVENLVLVQVRAQVLEPVFLRVVVLEEIPVVFGTAVIVLAERPTDEPLVDRLDDGIQPGELVVDIETRVRLARRGQAHPSEERHRQTLLQHGRILHQVIEDEGLQSGDGLVHGVAVGIDAESGFRLAAAAQPA